MGEPAFPAAHRIRLGAAFAIRIVVQQGVLGQQQAVGFVDAGHFAAREVESFENRDTLVFVGVRTLTGEGLDEKAREARLVRIPAP